MQREKKLGSLEVQKFGKMYMRNFFNLFPFKPLSFLTEKLSFQTSKLLNFLTSKCHLLQSKRANGKAFGFTMAEVLWTLVIISVVALLTVPSLITWKDKQVTIAGVQKSYSVLSEAVKRSEVDNGQIEYWYFSPVIGSTAHAQNFFNTYLAPFLRVSNDCGATFMCGTTIKKPNGDDFTLTSGWATYILNDGTIISLYNLGRASRDLSYNNTGGGAFTIFVDINGTKKPNTLGKDIFSFVITQIAAPIYNMGSGDLANGIKIGGVYPDGYGMDLTGGHYAYRGCGKDVTYGYAGVWCGAKIIKDGYQIKSDYPW